MAPSPNKRSVDVPDEPPEVVYMAPGDYQIDKAHHKWVCECNDPVVVRVTKTEPNYGR